MQIVSGRTARWSYPSAAAAADRHLVPVDDDGDLAFAAGVFQHLLEFRGVRLDIVILGPVSVSRPGLVCVGSTGLAVNDHLSRHDLRPSLFLSACV